MTITVTPIEFYKVFYCPDIRARRRPLTKQTKEALKGWAIKKAKRFTSGQGLIYEEPRIETERDAPCRTTEICVSIYYAPILGREGEIFVMNSKDSKFLVNMV